MITITIQAKRPSKKLIATLEYIAHHPEVVEEIDNYIIQKQFGSSDVLHSFSSFDDFRDYVVQR